MKRLLIIGIAIIGFFSCIQVVSYYQDNHIFQWQMELFTGFVCICFMHSMASIVVSQIIKIYDKKDEKIL